MQIRAGYEIAYDCPQPTPMMLMLSVHPSRIADLATPQRITLRSADRRPATTATASATSARASVRPPGRITISTDFLIDDSGLPDIVAPDAEQHARPGPARRRAGLSARQPLLRDRSPVEHRLVDCSATDRTGWARVQAICDYVHERLTFGYQHAVRPRARPGTAFASSAGVCRDFAHLAITLCRCMNIPARYCTGYLGDIGVPAVPDPMDFSAWFEAYLGGRWYTFDARHNKPRIGRILMARGRDATDVALSTSFGQTRLAEFKVMTDEVVTA